jgi:CDP-glucose 4,6-dehydratase
LGQKLLEGDTRIASGWNFGPAENSVITVLEAAAALQKGWSDIRFEVSPPPDMPHEAKLLMLNCAKAASVLDWHSVWSAQETFEMTSRWYRYFYTEGKLSTFEQLDKYICSATQRGYVWTK